MSKYIKTTIGEFLTEQREIFTTLYHGTDIKSAHDIKNNGVDISKSSGGYFGWGIYTTPDMKLAKSNYADFSDDDEGGVVIEFLLKKDSNILDLRDSDDWETWMKYARKISDRSMYKELQKNGIDGLFDNSFEGVVIYNPDVLIFKDIHK